MHSTHDRVGVSLRDLFPTAQFTHPGDLRAAAVCSQPEQCSPGTLFVPVLSADSDGHEWASEAVANGAAAIVAERRLPVAVPQVIVSDTRVALGEICQALVGRPSDSLRTIGVTGSRGKTVTTMLMASILETAGQTAGVISSVGYSDSLEQAATRQTTPRAPLLAKWLGQMTAAGCTDAVIEVSSRALAERRVAGVEFDAAILTNLRRDHVEFHGSAENYKLAKRRLFSAMKPGGFAVLNADDQESQSLLGEIDCPVLTYGLHAEAEITATILERCPSEQTFLLQAGHDSCAVRTAMIGDHHVSNCLAAASVALTLGIELPTIARGLEAVDRVPGRLERIECGQPFSVFVDVARSPDSLAHSLKSVRKVTSGRLICVFGASGGRRKQDRAMLGRVAERGSDLPVITGCHPRHEQPLQIAHALLDGFQRAAKAQILPGRAQAIRWALSQARPGDSVLIAGLGDCDYQIIGNQHVPHCDRAIAREWLYTQGDQTPARPQFRIVG